jgi:hypothetical protein
MTARLAAMNATEEVGTFPCPSGASSPARSPAASSAYNRDAEVVRHMTIRERPQPFSSAFIPQVL